jgi:DNA polymerase V
VLTVFVLKNRFNPKVPPPYSRSATLTLPCGPSADTLVLMRYAALLLSRLWERGAVYHKAGVVLDGLEPPSSGQQLTLFASPAPTLATSEQMLPNRPQLMDKLDALNQRFGRGTVRLGSTVPAPASTIPGLRAPWEGQAQWQSPAFTTQLKDLLTVN